MAEARKQALANRRLARAGGDPLDEKRRLVGIPTFAEAARRVVEHKRAGWRSAAHAKDWLRTLEIHACPRIGDVTGDDVLEILTPIWHTEAPTAWFLYMWVRAALEWAIAMEWRTDSPCDWLLHLLGSSTMSSSTIGRCLTVMWRRPSRRCGRRSRVGSIRQRSSSWC